MFPSRQTSKVWKIGCLTKTQKFKVENSCFSPRPTIQSWTLFSSKPKRNSSIISFLQTKICVPSEHQGIKVGHMCVLTKTKMIWEWSPQEQHFKMGHMRLLIETKTCKLQLFVFHQNQKLRVGSIRFP